MSRPYEWNIGAFANIELLRKHCEQCNACTAEYRQEIEKILLQNDKKPQNLPNHIQMIAN